MFPTRTINDPIRLRVLESVNQSDCFHLEQVAYRNFDTEYIFYEIQGLQI